MHRRYINRPTVSVSRLGSLCGKLLIMRTGGIRLTLAGSGEATFQVFQHLKSLPPASCRLFSAQRNFALSSAWFSNMIENGLQSDSDPRFAVLTDGASLLAILPLLCTNNSSVSSLTNFYTCVYRPLISTEGSVSNT